MSTGNKGRRRRPEHPEFIKYMEFIVEHPNYQGLPYRRTEDGRIVWVATKNSKLGQERLKWWQARRRDGESLRDVAFRLHPTKKRPCQICGRVMEIGYVYPSFNRLARMAYLLEKRGLLTKELREFLKDRETGLTHIREVLVKLEGLGGEPAMEVFAEVFGIPHGIRHTPDEMAGYLLSLRVDDLRNRLSPGVWGNPPDRFDGFHSYNLCCRSLHDRGRSRENLSKYGEDRRAYEAWVDGDHKAASWVMREIRKRGWSADHIGPLSQGFTHRPNGFRPVTDRFQSERRDRLRAKDVRLLLEAEEQGERVVSWHVRSLWNALKEWAVASDDRAEALGRAMRAQVHDTLTLLSYLLEAGHEDFLCYLRRGLYESHLIRIERIEIVGVNDDEVKAELRATGEYHRPLRVVVRVADRQLRAEHRRSALRALRKSIESLRKYASANIATVGSNRRLSTLSKEEAAELLAPVLDVLNLRSSEASQKELLFEAAEKRLQEVVDYLGMMRARQLCLEWGCDLPQPTSY